MIKVYKVTCLNLISLFLIGKILYFSGKKMKNKYGLTHWDNGVIKTILIVLYCSLRNEVYLVNDDKDSIATFQIKQKGDLLYFYKLATAPDFQGSGVGSFCLRYIEMIAGERDCESVRCDVLKDSEHALRFYLNRGYVIYDEKKTLKYQEYLLEKRNCLKGA